MVITAKQVLKEIEPDWQVTSTKRVYSVKQIHEAMETFGRQLVLAYIEELKAIQKDVSDIENGTREMGLELVQENEIQNEIRE